MTRAAVLLLVIGALGACAPAEPAPAPFDASAEPCRYCRMVGSSGRFAAELVAPGEEPIFFDDIGCLRDFLATQPALAAGTVAFVADHRTREWVRSGRAVYTRQARLSTPMSSHLMAHTSSESREADSDATDGERIAADVVFAPARAMEGVWR
jgi:copper chaperone NosL